MISITAIIPKQHIIKSTIMAKRPSVPYIEEITIEKIIKMMAKIRIKKFPKLFLFFI